MISNLYGIPPFTNHVCKKLIELVWIMNLSECGGKCGRWSIILKSTLQRFLHRVIQVLTKSYQSSIFMFSSCPLTSSSSTYDLWPPTTPKTAWRITLELCHGREVRDKGFRIQVRSVVPRVAVDPWWWYVIIILGDTSLNLKITHTIHETGRFTYVHEWLIFIVQM